MTQFKHGDSEEKPGRVVVESNPHAVQRSNQRLRHGTGATGYGPRECVATALEAGDRLPFGEAPLRGCNFG